MISALALLLAGMVAPPALAGPDEADARVDASVQAQLEEKDEVEVIVYFEDRADLTAASRIADWEARGAAVVAALQQTAAASQAHVVAGLESRKVDHRAYWGVNAIHIPSADAATVREVAKDSEVSLIDTNREQPLPLPSASLQDATTNAIEWGISFINADDVWGEFGTQGEGIVIANIDSGVQFNHPALVNSYRGNLGGGSFDHNYNWVDPSVICGNPSLVPCDNNGHGTHTMGTMVGDDGLSNQIGVAPGARWIAAKGCESTSCSTSALISSGQWMLAPTRLDGSAADPSKRPHIINNSWGGGGNDPFYDAIVDNWVAAGIFPAFSAGNSGPGCNTDGSPGDYSASYAVGAFDINGAIAGFSSRGPGRGGDIKPNIAAPGVNVRSSVPTNGYASYNGTSMASPHLAGTVALMWSAGPSSLGDIAGTRLVLDDSAVDTNDTSCGGTADDNNVFGEGKLNALAAVTAVAGPAGTLTGNVMDLAGSPVEGAEVTVDGPIIRSTSTDPAGNYTMALPVGSYDVTVTAFGYEDGFSTATVVDDTIETLDFVLEMTPRGDLDGLVLGGGTLRPGATVTVVGAPTPPLTTGPDGSFSFPDFPQGTYDLTASFGVCYQPVTHTVTVGDDPTSVDFLLPAAQDAFGHRCAVGNSPYQEAPTALGLTGDDTSAAVSLPFAFPFYGSTYTTAYMASNGFASLTAASTAYANGTIPSASAPNGALYPMWDDLLLDASSTTASGLTGTAPDRRFVLEWRNARFYDDATRVDIQVELREDGVVEMRHRNVDATGRTRGGSATVGIENPAGTDALALGVNAQVLADGRSLLITPPSVRTIPTLTGAASPDVVLGGQVSDTATVSGRQDAVEDSTVRFALYGPDDSTCSTPPVFTDTVVISSTATSVTSGSFTPDQAGTYRWVAEYTGDPFNEPVAGACGDSGQDVQVTTGGAETCMGLPATIVGTPGDDVLDGTAGVDVIVGLGGNDTINGMNGSDVICGGDGDDVIAAGGGQDQVDGGDGNDVVRGQNGDDILYGGPGDDRVQAGGGNDIGYGGEGKDILTGSAGDDELHGGPGNDRLIGNGGVDHLFGEDGNDVFHGGGGDPDVCDGGPHTTQDRHIKDCEVLIDIP